MPPVYLLDAPEPTLDDLVHGDKLDRLLREIGNLSVTMHAVRISTSEPLEDIWYIDKIYYLQSSLYDIIHQPPYESGILDTACAFAALIFCGHCLRDVPLSFSVHIKAVTRLKTAIEIAQSSIAYTVDPHLRKRLFWILGLGGTAAEGKPEKPWFVDQLRNIFRDMHLNGSWESARPVLKSVLWNECLDEPGKKLWEEVMSGST